MKRIDHTSGYSLYRDNWSQGETQDSRGKFCQKGYVSWDRDWAKFPRRTFPVGKPTAYFHETRLSIFD